MKSFDSALSREKYSKLAANICAIIAVVAVLNCWWLLSLFLNKTQFDPFQLFASSSSSSSSSSSNKDGDDIPSTSNLTAVDKRCNFAKGRWVHDSKPPTYSNETCKYIHPSLDCMGYGRPNRGYLYWKWKPLECELMDFDASRLLGLMKDKAMVFIGDSIARNHMQSLLCTLSQVEEPQNLYFDVEEKEATWVFASFNFTIANRWSPFLVNHTFVEDVYHIHLDLPDVMWSSSLTDYNVVIVSTGYWYFRPSIYYMKNMVLGTNLPSTIHLNTFDKLRAMRIAWEIVLNHLVENFKGITILRTITVPHYPGISWDDGGSCNQTQPIFDPFMQEPFPWATKVFTKIQSEAFSRAMDHIRTLRGEESISKLRLLNVTYSSLLRPDGHPNSYRIQSVGEPPNDCLHWCLPGPIDTWNQILLSILLE